MIVYDIRINGEVACTCTTYEDARETYREYKRDLKPGQFIAMTKRDTDWLYGMPEFLLHDWRNRLPGDEGELFL